MKHIIACLLFLVSSVCLADKPDVLPGNNGNQYAYGKEQNNGNHFGTSQQSVAIPEASTLALVGLGFAGFLIARYRKK